MFKKHTDEEIESVRKDADAVIASHVAGTVKVGDEVVYHYGGLDYDAKVTRAIDDETVDIEVKNKDHDFSRENVKLAKDGESPDHRWTAAKKKRR